MAVLILSGSVADAPSWGSFIDATVDEDNDNHGGVFVCPASTLSKGRMMSAWDVYWVMQADSIRNLFLLAGVVGSFGFAGGWAIFTADSVDKAGGYSPDRAAIPAALGAKCRRLFFLTLPLLVVAVLMPSTKTLALMHVLPAIANSEEVQSEARELYELAKQGLRQAIEVEQESDED